MRRTPRSLASPRIVNIHDLRHLAKRRLPRVVFDYLDGGAESEVTLRENCRISSKGPVWYQLYLVGGREVAEGAIDRARRAGFTALVVTIDTPVAGMRERDPRNGMKELLG